MNCHASSPWPRGDRSWWDDGPVEPPEPDGPDPIWRGLLIGFSITLLLAAGVAFFVLVGGGS